MNYRYGSHTVYDIEYHFVWVTKYKYLGIIILTKIMRVEIHDLS